MTSFYSIFASKCCDTESLSDVCSRWHLEFIFNGPALVAEIASVSRSLDILIKSFTVTWKVNIEFPMQICRQSADTRHGNEKIWCESSLIISTSWTETERRDEERRGEGQWPTACAGPGHWGGGPRQCLMRWEANSEAASYMNQPDVIQKLRWLYINHSVL